MKQTENWEERLQQFKKEQIVKSEPEDYIHVGLDASCQYSTLEHFIRTELESAHREGYELGLKVGRNSILDEIIEFIESETLKYMGTGEAKRMLLDKLNGLKETKDWGDTPLLCKCAQTLKDFVEGKITTKEAKRLIEEHDCQLQKEMLAVSFKTGKKEIV